ncbi:high light inducible protein [Pseudanabaena sp. FACHB-2040]|uniref:high light inducible protein n=1 Tax=Pseudanabaena sp. FACHB-2040 TaxID=2692859 RepID=UPI001688079A|nr:high light inducible protein [Pseudanabaena sp. FACHB-2040]MBD0268895.1 high light inducible protein [Cyanobacteria bacterium Co-bin8]MBD2257308.1 high light inducible protein [Pseudanabaena sp. FACHB-2040]
MQQIKETKQAAQQAPIDNSTSLPRTAKAYNGYDRNAWIFGWNPQQELWNGRLAMIGFSAYLLWDWAGYSVLRDVLHLVR